MTEKYEFPLSSRYASEYMLRLFSADHRIQTWHKLWVSLAKVKPLIADVRADNATIDP